MIPTNKNSQYKKDIRKKLFKRSKGRCDLCNKELSIITATIDHRIPLSRGGTWDISNLQLCCKKCNFSKGNLTTNEYLDQVLQEKV